MKKNSLFLGIALLVLGMSFAGCQKAEKNQCTVKGCGGEVYSNGLCPEHYVELNEKLNGMGVEREEDDFTPTPTVTPTSTPTPTPNPAMDYLEFYTNYTYEYVSVKSVKPGYPSEITIPQEVNGYPVTVIGYGAFEGCDDLLSITIPEGVTKIDDRAFGDCTNLTTVNLPDSLEKIGAWKEGTGAFDSCKSLKTIVIPAGVEAQIGTVFTGCSELKKIEIRGGKLSFGDPLFSLRGCLALEVISVPADFINLSDFDISKYWWSDKIVYRD